ncbi:MAG: AMP-binding protein [Deltaproteobacteria bacterium]|nr:AMP-binding protein [Deltaproteobacteria bacterium]
MIRYAKSDRIVSVVLRDIADRIPDKIFVRTREGQVTYSEMEVMSNRFANAFRNLGLKRHDKACLLLDNNLEHMYCWFGLWKAGVADVPINTAYKGQILQYVIDNSEARVLVVDQNYLGRIQFLEDEIKNIEKVVVYTPKGAKKPDIDLKLDCVDMDEFASFPADSPDANVHFSDPATILYTSGTTGPSKGVMMSHANCHIWGENVVENLGLVSSDIDYTCLPLFHANARLMTVYPSMLAEAQVAVSPRFSLSRFWDDIRFFKATVFNGLGAIGPLLFSVPPKPDDTDNPVRLAFLVPAPDYKEYEKRFGLKVITAYGMTECNLPLFSPLDEKMPDGACGKPVKGFQVRIVDEYDDEVPPGQVGEVVVRNDQPYGILSGYYNMPEKTLEAYRNLWFHTGDAMYRDENGWHYFVDRIKDALRRRGENISSFEVESVINSHPAVLESAVIAVKDPVLTEDEVKACIVLQPGASLTEEELIRFCEPRMPYFHVPRYIEFMDELPKTPTDKIRKHVLREAGLTPQTWDREEAGITIKR